VALFQVGWVGFQFATAVSPTLNSGTIFLLCHDRKRPFRSQLQLHRTGQTAKLPDRFVHYGISCAGQIEAADRRQHG
jgi:hypothetical protein